MFSFYKRLGINASRLGAAIQGPGGKVLALKMREGFLFYKIFLPFARTQDEWYISIAVAEELTCQVIHTTESAARAARARKSFFSESFVRYIYT